MTIDIKSLKYFQAVVRHKSFTKAANELRIEQPALSLAIKRLEEALGVTLFTRRSKDVLVNPEAVILLKRAENIFDELRLARQEVQTAAELRVGEVRVGMPPMFGERYFPPLIAAFRARYPAVTLSAHEGGAEDVRTLLDSGALDLGMLENRRVPENWRSVEVGQDQTMLCVGRDHPLARQKTAPASCLDGLEMAVFDTTFLQRMVLDTICKSAGVNYKQVLQSNFVPVIRSAVQDGIAAATLLHSTVEGDASIVALPFDPPEIFRFSLCWRKDAELSNANRAFVDFAVERYRSSDDGGNAGR